jgi:hypothetical protein
VSAPAEPGPSLHRSGMAASKVDLKEQYNYAAIFSPFPQQIQAKGTSGYSVPAIAFSGKESKH